ncbi:MAG: MBL fold metallo-hydrolase [Gammaproteobacteria bacterium]|nr:MBL fold metallo-hydrolase [Gammaproteobacteria bacterium]
MLPLVLPARDPPPLLELLMLDAGQGSAVVVRTARHSLVYDAGPRFSERFEAGGAIVAPALARSGVRRLDRLVISHADNDHAGGAAGLFAALPVDDALGAEGIRGPRIAILRARHALGVGRRGVCGAASARGAARLGQQPLLRAAHRGGRARAPARRRYRGRGRGTAARIGAPTIARRYPAGAPSRQPQFLDASLRRGRAAALRAGIGRPSQPLRSSASGRAGALSRLGRGDPRDRAPRRGALAGRCARRDRAARALAHRPPAVLVCT